MEQITINEAVFRIKILIEKAIKEGGNLLTLATSEEQLRRSVKDFAEKHGLDRFFLYGFGSHHFYLHQRYTSDPEMVMKNRILSVHF